MAETIEWVVAVECTGAPVLPWHFARVSEDGSVAAETLCGVSTLGMQQLAYEEGATCGVCVELDAWEGA